MPNIQYVSDLHLEFEPDRTEFEDILQPSFIVNEVNKNSNILILAGDICTTQHLPVLTRFLKYCKLYWRKVIYIPGNHEYYYSSFDEANKILNDLCEQEGVIFAYEKVIQLKLKVNPNASLSEEKLVTIICTTLWSELNLKYVEEIKAAMNDYKLIKDFTPEKAIELHNRAKQFINENVNRLGGDIRIVATHHAPLLKGTGFPKYEGNELNSAFCSDCSSLMPNVNYWIYGHTHFNARRFTINIKNSTTTILTNQRGYKGTGKFYSTTANLLL